MMFNGMIQLFEKLYVFKGNERILEIITKLIEKLSYLEKIISNHNEYRQNMYLIIILINT